MAAFPSLVLTNAGVALQNKVQGGATLEFTNIQMGSGQLNGQPIGPLTALISLNATVPIQGGQAVSTNTYQVSGFFTNASLSAGFWWREIGVFANDPDLGEILYAYANAGDAGDYIPTLTDQRIEKTLYVSIALANAATVTVTIPQTDTYVLKSEVNQPGGVAGLNASGQLEETIIPSLPYDQSGSAEAVQANFTAHAGNTNNPHGVTAAQVGAIPTSELGQPGGVASLGPDGKLDPAQAPDVGAVTPVTSAPETVARNRIAVDESGVAYTGATASAPVMQYSTANITISDAEPTETLPEGHIWMVYG